MAPVPSTGITTGISDVTLHQTEEVNSGNSAEEQRNLLGYDPQTRNSTVTTTIATAMNRVSSLTLPTRLRYKTDASLRGHPPPPSRWRRPYLPTCFSRSP